MPPKGSHKNKADHASEYQKLSPEEHILRRPEMYMGSIVPDQPRDRFIMHDPNCNSVKKSNMSVVAGLYKIIDEILVNALDNKQRNTKGHLLTQVDVTYDQASGKISVANNGRGIAVAKDPKHGLWLPDMIFGHLLTSSNYDDKSERETGGRHGYGAKLTNLFSTSFKVKTVHDGKVFKKSWKTNMSESSDPVITDAGNNTPEGTTIEFTPDYKRFGITKKTLPSDFVDYIRIRVAELAAMSKDVTVTFNGRKIPFESFTQYAEAFPMIEFTEKHPNFVFEDSSRKYDLVVIAQSTGQFFHRAFANGVRNDFGGTHVTAMKETVAKALNMVEREMAGKGYVFNTKMFLNNLGVFINVRTPQPKFDSQSKNRLISECPSGLTAPALTKKLGEAFMACKPLLKMAQKEEQSVELEKANKELKKATSRLDIPKLDDAALAGVEPEKCTLILTEGDSAKALALSGLNTEQRKTFGVFPLRGKLLNVMVKTHRHAVECVELKSIMLALGLRFGEKYTATNDLRYGKVMIMTDQDLDGSHIKGLVITMFYHLWPSLLQMKGFLSFFVTPLLKVFPVKGVRQNAKVFYRMEEFEAYKKDKKNAQVLEKGEVKYYKGLGSSTGAEGREYFSRLEVHRSYLQYSHSAKEKELLVLVFGKDQADDRKVWLSKQNVFECKDVIDYFTKNYFTIPDFVGNEMRQFALYDNYRMVPSAIDGLKPSSRKILWALLKRKLDAPAKVSQLGGYVSEASAYHHGEASLFTTMIHLAQDFTGSNNINLLVPDGQFGSRHENGSDWASPRYIFTMVNKITFSLFPKADEALLTYNVDDGRTVEPHFYVPILPMVLINGSVGIGVGHATNIPCRNPLDLIRVLRVLLEGGTEKEAKAVLADVKPWFRGFLGEVCVESQTSEAQETRAIRKAMWHVHKQSSGDTLPPLPVYDDSKFITTGCYEVHGINRNKVKLRIVEIPMNTSVKWYKGFLARQLEKGKIYDYREYTTDNVIDFEVVVDLQVMSEWALQGTILRHLGLVGRGVQENYTSFDSAGHLADTTNTVEKTFFDYYQTRLETYERRRKYLMKQLSTDIARRKELLRFSELAKKLDFSQTLEQITDVLKKKNFQPAPGTKEDYGYLLNRSIASITRTDTEGQQKAIKRLEDQLATTTAMKPQKMWLSELDDVEPEIKEVNKARVDLVVARQNERVPRQTEAEALEMNEKLRDAYKTFHEKRVKKKAQSNSGEKGDSNEAEGETGAKSNSAPRRRGRPPKQAVAASVLPAVASQVTSTMVVMPGVWMERRLALPSNVRPLQTMQQHVVMPHLRLPNVARQIVRRMFSTLLL